MDFEDFLIEIEKEEKKFIKNYNPKSDSFSVALLNSSRLQFKTENENKEYYCKFNAGPNDFADYGEFLASIIAKFVVVNAIKTHLTCNETEYGVIMDNFKNPKKEYISLSSILQSFNEVEMRTYDKVVASVKFFCEDNDIICDASVERDLKRLILFDYMLLQQDRHGENIEFEISKNKKGDKVLKLAPIFDNEFCFLFLYDESLWNNYKYNMENFLSRIFVFSKEESTKALAKEIIKSEDLTNILEKFMQVDIKKTLDLCDKISSKKIPIKYKNIVNALFENQKKQLCLEIKALSIKKYCESEENEI